MTRTEAADLGENLKNLNYSAMPRRSRRGLWSGAAFALLMAAGFIACCSGLNLPIPFPRSDLGNLLARGYGVRLPGSAVVERGSRQAYRDPARYFIVRMAPADVAEFVAGLRASASRKGLGLEEGKPPLMPHFGPPPPAWWDPNTLSGPQWLGLSAPDGTRFWIIYCEQDGRVLVYGYST